MATSLVLSYAAYALLTIRRAKIGNTMSHAVQVLKFGGSVLAVEADYRLAAEYALKRQEQNKAKLVIVVSAQFGHTDILEQQAAAIDSNPRNPALDILWSTGELRSVALFALHLSRLDCDSRPLHIHQTGVMINRDEVEVDPSFIEAHLQSDDVIILPGFFGLNAQSHVVSLGRGGSDLSAVLYADALNCGQCELIKDVSGYYSSDPKRNPSATHIAALEYDCAISRSKKGEQIVQERALIEAKRRSITIRVSGLSHTGPYTLVGGRPSEIEEEIALRDTRFRKSASRENSGTL